MGGSVGQRRRGPERRARPLEWSHQLLEPDEQRLFRRLGAFRGSFSLAAVETICSDELESTRRHHASFCLRLGQSARVGLTSSDQVRWMEELELEHANLSEALL